MHGFVTACANLISEFASCFLDNFLQDGAEKQTTFFRNEPIYALFLIRPCAPSAD